MYIGYATEAAQLYVCSNMLTYIYIGFAPEAAQLYVCSRMLTYIYIGFATDAAQLYESIDMNGDVATQATP